MVGNGPQTYSVRELKQNIDMEYKGKLYGHLGDKIYFDTGKTADDWDNLEKRIAELEDENKALSMSGVSGSVPYVDREKVLEESLSVLLEMASTWGREWFKSETWEKVEKARQVLAGTDR